MRQALLASVARERGSAPAVTSIAAPVWGWDALNPLAAMKPDHAVQLDNWFPQPEYVEVRRGEVIQSDTGTGQPVETILVYNGPLGERLFAAADGTIWNVGSDPAASSSTGYTNNRWQWTAFAGTGGNFTYAVNGADLAQYYDGATWTDSVTTGVTSDAFINLTVHKNRIWAVLKDSTTAAYLPVDSIAGAAETFEIGGYLTKGGMLQAIGTWTVDAGSGPDDYLVFLSSEGQAVIFAGLADPTDPADFRLVGVFDLGPPLGLRCMLKVGPDLAIICKDGVISLAKSIQLDRGVAQRFALTERIQSVMNSSARIYGDNFGWEIIGYPRGTRAILNVPIAENSLQEQYVMNTITGAWCRFTGMSANCWGVYQDRLFFGGNDGVVYEADRGGQAANGAVLTAIMQTAFNPLTGGNRIKQAELCRPLIVTDGAVSPALAINFDFRNDTTPVASPSIRPVVALWDVAVWDADVWPTEIETLYDWQSVTGEGYRAAITMRVDIEDAPDEITLQVNGFDLQYLLGSTI